MTRDEVVKLHTIISESWRNFTTTKANVEIWFDLLKDLDFQIVLLAVKRLASGSPHPPAVSEIRKECAWIMAPPELRADLASAWEEVSKAIKVYGPNDEAIVLEKLSPIVRRVVEAIGWERICFDEAEVVRGQFLRMYKDLKDALLKELASPPEARLPEPPRPQFLPEPKASIKIEDPSPERMEKVAEMIAQIRKKYVEG